MREWETGEKEDPRNKKCPFWQADTLTFLLKNKDRAKSSRKNWISLPDEYVYTDGINGDSLYVVMVREFTEE